VEDWTKSPTNWIVERMNDKCTATSLENLKAVIEHQANKDENQIIIIRDKL